MFGRLSRPARSIWTSGLTQTSDKRLLLLHVSLSSRSTEISFLHRLQIPPTSSGRFSEPRCKIPWSQSEVWKNVKTKGWRIYRTRDGEYWFHGRRANVGPFLLPTKCLDCSPPDPGPKYEPNQVWSLTQPALVLEHSPSQKKSIPASFPCPKSRRLYCSSHTDKKKIHCHIFHSRTCHERGWMLI